jgi:hypothetical protein
VIYIKIEETIRQSSNIGGFNDALQTDTVSLKNINTSADSIGHRSTSG